VNEQVNDADDADDSETAERLPATIRLAPHERRGISEEEEEEEEAPLCKDSIPVYSAVYLLYLVVMCCCFSTRFGF